MSEPAAPRFLKPKILLVDLPDALTRELREAGFNVQSGSFGRPYSVPQGDGFLPIVRDADLPNYTEQEVIVIDLTSPSKGDQPAKSPPVAGKSGCFAHTGQGHIDPRSLAMLHVSESWDRILLAGGTFVVFARPRRRQRIVLGTVRFDRLTEEKDITVDNWSFLSVLSPELLRIDDDHGTETVVRPPTGVVGDWLRTHQAGVEFSAVFTSLFRQRVEGNQYQFLPLMGNKYGACVGGLVTTKQGEGRVFILPQFVDKARAVSELVRSVLPELCPHLFPDFVGGRWVQAVEYEHPSILSRRAEQERIQKQADVEITRLNGEIEAERERFGFLHTLLTGTGEDLVAAAKAALEHIGFANVVLVDEGEAEGNKQEDLQLHDRSPTPLLEVKGIGGLPGESDTHQVTKYVLRRMKQWSRTDVTGVFLVNHQRNLPALDRNHANVFTPPQVADAEANGTGLITTWDLFRLIRGMMRWNWPKQAVQDVFYHTGRLPNIPSHYQRIGTVAHYYTEKSVLSIDVGESELRVGDTVGFLFEDSFFEEVVTSLQVNRQPVPEATAGQRAGYKTSLRRNEVPEGTVIYAVRPVTK
jgi:hypothetical protein